MAVISVFAVGYSMLGQKILKMAPLSIQKFDLEDTGKLVAIVAASEMTRVYLIKQKRVDRPHYQVTTPNEMHQFDLLYMPSDSLYGNKYKYILARIDAASRFKVTRPLRTKQARDVAEMIADIYKV